MRRFRIALALLLSATYAIGLLASLRPPALKPVPVPPPTAAAPLPPITLQCEVDPASLGRPSITFRGTTSLPDGSPLTLYLSRFPERDRDGRLEPELIQEVLDSGVVSRGRFIAAMRIPVPGCYRLRVESA